MQDMFDAIVIGGGIIGRLTAWLFAKSGNHTLLLEQDSLARPRGSSRGISRMFGESFADNLYYQLAHQSRSLWQNLEFETGEKLLSLNGGLDISVGADAREDIKGIASALKSRNSQFEIFDSASLRRRYPQWQCDSKTYAIYSPDSGILEAERCMGAAVLAAQEYGAVIREQSRVTSIEPFRLGTVTVKVATGETYCTRKLVIAAGPWMPNILKRLGVKLPLRVSQEQTVYFAPRCNAELFQPNNFPVWEWSGSDFVYGFPMFEKDGIKIAFHGDGHYLKNLKDFSHTPSKSVIKRLRSFLNKHIPDAAGEAFGAATCLYTNTPDEDFVIDTIPGFPQIAYFTGCSGHAFHCAPAIGETLMELAIDGKTTLDISPFSLKRFKV